MIRWRNLSDVLCYKVFLNYEISDTGIIRTVDAHQIKSTQRKYDGVKRFYQQVLFNSKGKKQVFAMHRLVAAAFLGLDINDKTRQVHHIDRDKSNNHYKNLKVVTAGDHIWEEKTAKGQQVLE
ncbi:HNH endonuclease [Leuconostoc citreum]